MRTLRERVQLKLESLVGSDKYVVYYKTDDGRDVRDSAYATLKGAQRRTRDLYHYGLATQGVRIEREG